jgi:hypothetical protein
MYKGREKPELAVQHFVDFLNKRKLEEAYWLLTSPERAAVPLTEWRSDNWNSPNDELAGRVTRTRIIQAKYTSSQKTEAIVEVALDLSGDGAELETHYTTRLEADGWHVYLGLDRSTGTWQGVSSPGF